MHSSFATTTRGLDRSLPPMRLYEKAKRLGIWNPSDIDLTRDQADWSALTDSERDLIGHIGGDDFVLVLCSADWHERCERLLSAFKEAALEFSSSEEQAAGGIWSEDRRGQKQFFPLLGLSIGVVLPDPARCHSHHDVAALAAKAKHQAKRRRGAAADGALYVDRRRGPDSVQTTASPM